VISDPGPCARGADRRLDACAMALDRSIASAFRGSVRQRTVKISPPLFRRPTCQGPVSRVYQPQPSPSTSSAKALLIHGTRAKRPSNCSGLPRCCTLRAAHQHHALSQASWSDPPRAIWLGYSETEQVMVAPSPATPRSPAEKKKRQRGLVAAWPGSEQRQTVGAMAAAADVLRAASLDRRPTPAVQAIKVSGQEGGVLEIALEAQALALNLSLERLEPGACAEPLAEGRPGREAGGGRPGATIGGPVPGEATACATPHQPSNWEQ